LRIALEIDLSLSDNLLALADSKLNLFAQRESYMTALIRASSLNGYRELVRTLGGDPENYLQQFGISAALIDDEFGLYPLRSFVNLLEVTAEDLECPDFGLRLSAVHGGQHLGPLGIIGANSTTVGEAMQEILENLDFHCPAVMARLDTRICPGKPTLTWDFSLPDASHRTQIDESAVGNIYQEFRILAQGDFVPEMVLFRHSATKPLNVYRRFFRTQVFFQQEVNGVVIKPEVLNRKLAHVNPQLHKLALAFVREAIHRQKPDLVGQVRLLITRLLQTRRFGIGDVAKCLGVHERTLQRKLKTSNASFDDILDAVRETRAAELLRHSEVSMAHIATLLGYAEQASLSRACLRWFGANPSAVRQRARLLEHSSI
jgi:AraC-like DNA-binding protein